MTAPPEVTPLISQIPMGPPAFLTVSNVAPLPLSPLGQRLTVYFDSDQSFISNVAWYSPDDQTIVPGQVTEAGANAKGHAPVIDLGTPHPGKHVIFTITVDPTDTSGLTLRPYVGVYDMPGARIGTALAVPVRFYAFGGTPPPGAHGGPTGSNWNTYTWAQYNPKGTTYPTP